MAGHKNNNFENDDGDKRMSFINGGSDLGPLFDVFLPCLSDECIDWMVQREKELMPRDDYVKRLINGGLDLMILRNDSLRWIVRACADHNFRELCEYTATSYFDRFLSVREFSVPSQEPNRLVRAIQLVAVACLSLAAKMQEIDVPFLMDLQAREPKCIFEGTTIHRMEMLIPNALKWRLKPYTPFDFIDFYLRNMNGGELPPHHVIATSTQVIISTLGAIKFLEYKPSEIAASVAFCALGDIHEMDIERTWSDVLRVENKVGEVIEVFTASKRGTRDLTIIKSGVVNARVDNPNMVLQVAPRLSSTVESEEIPKYKRRKLNNSQF